MVKFTCQLPWVSNTPNSQATVRSKPLATSRSIFNGVAPTLTDTSYQPEKDPSNDVKATNVDGVVHIPSLGDLIVCRPLGHVGFCQTDTSARLFELRQLMQKDKIDYYIVPSEDAHQSEYVAASDKRREFISGFSGSAGTAIISLNGAYLFVDSRYYLQAEREIDSNWTLFKVGLPGVKPWDEWLLGCPPGVTVGMDSRLIAHDTATALTSALKLKNMCIAYPQGNLVDQIWKDRPSKSVAPVYIHEMRFAGEHASEKLRKLRAWLRDYSAPVTDLHPNITCVLSPSHQSEASEQPSSKSSRDHPLCAPSRQNSDSDSHAPARTPLERNPSASVGGAKQGVTPPCSMFVSSLNEIAWLLNLRGGDIPYNPLFHAYLWVGVDGATLFVQGSKLGADVHAYLRELRVESKEISEIWGYLRKREFGNGKVIISPKTPYVVSLLLVDANYIVAPSYLDAAKAVKNPTEIEGFKRAYLRDGVAMAKGFAWLKEQLRIGNTVTEWEAAEMFTEFRKQEEYFMGLAYETVSATGANAALPDYTPTPDLSSAIDVQTPYVNDSGGQYRDGTCDTTRTVHFGHPSDEQREAFTRVLKGQIAIDSVIFPQGTTGKQLDVLARHALWKAGLNYLHDTGHGFGSFLSVHEVSHGFGLDVPLQVGHVITNEPGFYQDGSFGIRIENALVVRKVKTPGQFGGDVWLGFKRFTCLPIQTKMVKMELLTRDEKRWLKEHNRKCRDKLAPHLQDDPPTVKWIRQESNRTIVSSASRLGRFMIGAIALLKCPSLL
ncbi:hypothetical protein FRC08_005144 [Ceratobasidium sp. 394]|nr:hypothetical protein FRC08_005144 [Ceratobasidium sp. 394]